ncbi:MAG TPA: HU family DNA-binding protein [Polyangia bacterium]|jgi:DNA-binding protein HU-beta|nr:HU family DNA-binding protein [Polyangia bacterium]
MTKQELIEKVAATPGLPPELTKKAVATLVDAVFAELGDYFVKAKVTRRATPRFTYPGFGTFTKKRKSGRTGRNPQTGAPLLIPPSVTVAFQPGQELKAFLNRTALKSQG